MEVFCIGLSPAIAARMQKNPEVMPQAIGANTVYAGVLNVRIALSMIKGTQPVTQEITPSIINASDLKDDLVTALAGLAPSDLKKDYNEAWMDELRTYYKK
jgi:hypothetical protein